MRSYLLLFLVLMLGMQALLYLGVASNYSLLDDATSIEPLFSEYSRNGVVLLERVFENKSGPLGRPLPIASFIFQINQGHDYADLKSVNYILHLCLFLILILMLPQCIRYFYGGLVDSYALTITSLVLLGWSLNPIWQSTIFYTVQRMTILAALFSVMIFLSIFASAGREARVSAFGKWLVISSLFICAIFSKENALMIFPSVLVTALIMRDPSKMSNSRKLSLLGLLMFSGIVFLVASAGFWTEAYDYRSFTMIERLMTQTYLIPLYTLRILTLTALPSLMHDDVVLVTSILSWEFIGAIMIWLCFFLIIFFCAKSEKREWRAVAAFSAVFIVMLSMEATVLPLELHFDHRFYLPTLFLYFAIALSVINVCSSKYQNLAVLIFALYSVASLSLSIIPASAWSSYASQAVWELELSPKSARANALMSEASALAGNKERAYEYSLFAYALSKEEKAWDLSFRNLYLACVAGAPYERSVHQLKFQIAPVFNDADSIHAFAWMLAQGRCDRSLVTSWLLENGDELSRVSEESIVAVNAREQVMLYLKGLTFEYEYLKKEALLH